MVQFDELVDLLGLSNRVRKSAILQEAVSAIKALKREREEMRRDRDRLQQEVSKLATCLQYSHLGSVAAANAAMGQGGVAQSAAAAAASTHQLHHSSSSPHLAQMTAGAQAAAPTTHTHPLNVQCVPVRPPMSTIELYMRTLRKVDGAVAAMVTGQQLLPDRRRVRRFLERWARGAVHGGRDARVDRAQGAQARAELRRVQADRAGPAGQAVSKRSAVKIAAQCQALEKTVPPVTSPGASAENCQWDKLAFATVTPAVSLSCSHNSSASRSVRGSARTRCCAQLKAPQSDAARARPAASAPSSAPRAAACLDP